MFKKILVLAIVALPCFSCSAETLAEKLVNRFWTADTPEKLDNLLSFAYQKVYDSGSLSKKESIEDSSTIISYSLSNVRSTRTRDQIIVSYYVTSRQQSGELIYDFNGYRADVFTKVHGKWKMVLHTVIDQPVG